MATNIVAPARYTECDWGDLIEGTKEQLQELGIGIGCAFPGEPGGPRRELKTQDQRGYPARISNRYRDDGRFTCWLKFPQWPECPEMIHGPWSSVAQGVTKRQCIWNDEYMGSADDLAAVGLLRLDQLPGQPGMRKVRVTVLPDGSLPTSAPTANCNGRRAPDAKTIERASTLFYRVSVMLTKEEGDRRLEARRVAEDKWRGQVRALPRPARLQPLALSARAAATTKPRPAMQPARPPLFGDAPTGQREAYQKHVFDSLKELVDFAQTSAY